MFVIVELVCNIQNLLEMWLFELSFKRFLDEIFCSSEWCALLSLDVESNTLINRLLELQQKWVFFTQLNIFDKLFRKLIRNWLSMNIFITILHFRFILHGIRNYFDLISTHLLVFCAWVFSNLEQSCSFFNLFLFFNFVLFSLSLGSFFSFGFFSFVLQPTRVSLLNVTTQVFQPIFFFLLQVIVWPFILAIQTCFFLRWAYCIYPNLIFFFLQQWLKLELLKVQLIQLITFSSFQIQHFSFVLR